MDSFPNLTKIDNLDTMQKNNELKHQEMSTKKYGTSNKNFHGDTSDNGQSRYHANLMAYTDGDRRKDGSALCFSGPKKGVDTNVLWSNQWVKDEKWWWWNDILLKGRFPWNNPV